MNLQYLLPCYGMDYIHCCCHIARIDILCRNLSLGLATKAKGVARLQAKRKSGSHITYSRECKEV
jgi:hypothetical protein